MAEPGTLESLQSLCTSLAAVSERRFSNLDRLGAELDAHVQYFRRLLDKKQRSNESRKSLETGKIEVSGDEYAVNSEFQHDTLQLADALDLDELEAARIFLDAQRLHSTSERPILTEAVIRFHQQRKYLLECLRLILQLSGDAEVEDEIRAGLHNVLSTEILQAPTHTKQYVTKCITAMANIRVWLQKLSELGNRATVTGQTSQPEFMERLEYERVSLIKQHESLGTILLYLVKNNFSSTDTLEDIVKVLRQADKYDNLLVHYIPALLASISIYGSIEGTGSTQEQAKALNDRIMSQADQNTWTLTYVHAAVRVWWLAEYSSWFSDSHDGSTPESQQEPGARQRAQQFSDALKDGAFDFILSLSADIKSVEWHDPARHGLRQWLQRKSPVILADPTQFADLFQELVQEQLETFVESIITNIPDLLRKLRIDEDSQRQLSKDHEHDLDLERFLVIISYAFEGHAKAAQEGFWDSKESALYGFLLWTSKRASTPLVSAFCEMLQALSEGDDNATSAHEFLLDEGAQSSSKMKRTHSLTWNQMFKELNYFSSKIRDRPAVPQGQYRPGKPSNLVEAEPESFLMLECYLRLITRLCMESSAARQFLFNHPTFHIVDLLFQLASSSIESRLRACAFTTLRALLSQKTREIGEYLWNTLDYWISGGYSPGSSITKAGPVLSTQASIQAILGGLSAGFEEPNAFVQLLHALVLPYEAESNLRDSLPFPEQLGSTTRMAGIDPYVDFAIGQIFALRSLELGDLTQVRLLQLTCLDFIATCLETFNENLVIFATESQISIDVAISTSSLREYVLLHPFARVMEWMYDERVMRALFASIHHDATTVASVAPDSPLILGVSRGIQVITKILELQPTYLDIVLPVIRAQPSSQRTPILSTKFGSFEEGVLNHLYIISDLGLLCGTSHPELVVSSLTLLQKLSQSPRLLTTVGATAIGGYGSNRLLAAIDHDAEAISAILIQEIESPLDVEEGLSSSAYVIKIQILDFLLACLQASPLRPSIAHRLLGFKCGRDSLSVESESLFDRGISLFHAVLHIALDTPLGDESGMSSWLISLAYKSQQVLKEVWSSPLSSKIAMAEMAVDDALSQMAISEVPIQGRILWDGFDTFDDELLLNTSAICLSDFLSRRAIILQYFAAQLRQVSKGHAPSTKQKIVGAILGSSTNDGGDKIDHTNLFDLFDFMEPKFNLIQPDMGWFSDLDFRSCQTDPSDPASIYDLEKVEELLLLRRAELSKAGRIPNETELQSVNKYAQVCIAKFAVNNQVVSLLKARQEVLNAWVQLALVVIGNADFDNSSRVTFILRSLQTIMPVLESDTQDLPVVAELGKLAKALLFAIDFKAESFKQGDMGELVSDRLFHLFQLSLRAANALGSESSLKEIFYNICYHYLTNMSKTSRSHGIVQKHSVQTIKSAGERFIVALCDDAYAATPSCRIAALLLLGGIVKLANSENSSFIVESLERLNFIGILVDSIRTIPEELRQTRVEDINILLFYCHAKLTLLLQISQTRSGASAVLSSGLFHSIHQSSLFATDPDLGVDIEGPDAVSKHYDLLSAIMRVILAAILSRGASNEQSLEQGRRFLTDNRLTILAVFKKSAGLGTGAKASEESILELAESFMVLVSITGFLDFEEGVSTTKQPLRAFT